MSDKQDIGVIPLPKERAQSDASNKQLNAALLEAQKSINEIQKEATNDFNKYKYVSAEAIIKEARRCLTKAGLVVRRGMWWYFPEDTDFNNEWGGLWRCNMTFHISHPGSGETYSETVEFPVIPGKGRPLDKALAGALTTAQSYFLRDLLLIPRVDEEMDRRDDRDHKPAQQSHQPAQTNKSISNDQVAEIDDLIITTKTDFTDFATYFGVKRTEDMTEAQYVVAKAQLLKKKRQIDGSSGAGVE